MCKQLGLPLSDVTKAHFPKQGGTPKIRRKTYTEEEINAMISEKVEVSIKASNKSPYKTDEGDAESVNMVEF